MDINDFVSGLLSSPFIDRFQLDGDMYSLSDYMQDFETNDIGDLLNFVDDQQNDTERGSGTPRAPAPLPKPKPRLDDKWSSDGSYTNGVSSQSSDEEHITETLINSNSSTFTALCGGSTIEEVHQRNGFDQNDSMSKNTQVSKDYSWPQNTSVQTAEQFNGQYFRSASDDDPHQSNSPETPDSGKQITLQGFDLEREIANFGVSDAFFAQYRDTDVIAEIQDQNILPQTVQGRSVELEDDQTEIIHTRSKYQRRATFTEKVQHPGGRNINQGHFPTATATNPGKVTPQQESFTDPGAAPTYLNNVLVPSREDDNFQKQCSFPNDEPTLSSLDDHDLSMFHSYSGMFMPRRNSETVEVDFMEGTISQIDHNNELPYGMGSNNAYANSLLTTDFSQIANNVPTTQWFSKSIVDSSGQIPSTTVQPNPDFNIQAHITYEAGSPRSREVNVSQKEPFINDSMGHSNLIPTHNTAAEETHPQLRHLHAINTLISEGNPIVTNAEHSQEVFNHPGMHRNGWNGRAIESRANNVSVMGPQRNSESLPNFSVPESSPTRLNNQSNNKEIPQNSQSMSDAIFDALGDTSPLPSPQPQPQINVSPIDNISVPSSFSDLVNLSSVQQNQPYPRTGTIKRVEENIVMDTALPESASNSPVSTGHTQTPDSGDKADATDHEAMMNKLVSLTLNSDINAKPWTCNFDHLVKNSNNRPDIIGVGKPYSLSQIECLLSASPTTTPSVTRHEETRAKVNEKPSSSRHSDKARLPPCRVCGCQATGFHYGVNTCESCYEFFRRCHRKKNIRTCAGKKLCVLKFGNSKGGCSYCRLQRCYAAGMCRDGIKTGRYSNTKLKLDAEEIRQYELKDRLVEDAAKMENVVNDLVRVVQRFTSFTINWDKDYLLSKQQEFIELYREHGSTLGMELTEGETVTLIDEGGEMFTTRMTARDIEVLLKKLSTFSKHLPGFKELPICDQSALIRRSWIEVMLLGTYWSVNTDLRCWTFRSGKTFHYDEWKLVLGDELTKTFFETAVKLQKMNLTCRETLVIKAIALTAADDTELKEGKKVEALHWFLIQCLQHELKKRKWKQQGHQGYAPETETLDNSTRALFTDIVDALTSLRELSQCFNIVLRTKDRFKFILKNSSLLKD